MVRKGPQSLEMHRQIRAELYGSPVLMFDFRSSISQSLSKKKNRQGDQNDQLTVYTYYLQINK